MQNLLKVKSTGKHSAAWGAILALAIGMTAATGPASAQQQQQQQQQQADPSSDVPVHMVVTVEPRHGAQAPALSADDVKVFARNTESKVTGWVPLQGDRAGLQLFILIDDSTRTRFASQFSDIKAFIEAQPVSTAIGVGYMRNGTVMVAQNLTNDHSLAAKSLRLPIGGGASSSPYLSLSDLMKKWPASEDRREILMFTSGNDPLGAGFSNDPYSNPYLQTALDHAQQGGFIVYSIYSGGGGGFSGRGGFRTTLNQSGLDLISQKTGGQAYYLGFGAPVDITPYLRDVSNRLKNQYGLTFLAKSTKKPALEPVKLRTETPNTSLISAENGFVKTGM
jgi:hypothetical protein